LSLRPSLPPSLFRLSLLAGSARAGFIIHKEDSIENF